MSTRAVVQVLGPREGKALVIGPYAFTFKTGLTNGAEYSIAEVSVPPGAGNFLHRHPCAETMYVVSGEFELFGDATERRRVGAGATMHVPPHAAHGFVNVGETSGVLLVVTPRAQEALFDDLAAASAGAPPDPERVRAVAARHGLEVLHLNDGGN